MTIRSSLYFSYAGKKSSDFGILNINVSNGMLEEPFLSGRELREVIIKGNDIPYFQLLKRLPLSFQVNFAFENTWENTDKIREIARWLNQSYYQELFFSDDITRIYYALVIDDPILIHNGLMQGYLTLNFRCNSPYTYTPIYQSELFDFSSSSPNIINFENKGDLECKPVLYIQKIGAGDLSIFNLSDGNREFKFTGLSDLEEITVYNEEKIIQSSTGLLRYNNFNGNYISLLPFSINTLNVVGTCKLKIRYQFTTLA